MVIKGMHIKTYIEPIKQFQIYSSPLIDIPLDFLLVFSSFIYFPQLNLMHFLIIKTKTSANGL